MISDNIEDVVKMALYHHSNLTRSKARKNLEDSSYRIRSCFESEDGVYMRLEERNGLQTDVKVCDIPEEYFGVKSPKAHPFIVTIVE